MEADFLVRHFAGDRVVLPHLDDLKDDLRDRFLRCQVCTQLYVTEQRGAKVLACGHGLCSLCLQQASTPEGVRCQQCSPARLVSGQSAPDRARVSLMDFVTKHAPDRDLGQQQTDPSLPDATVSFLTELREQLLTCTICEHAFDCEAHKLVTLSRQHEPCSRCARKMERGHSPFCRKEFQCPSGSPEVTLPAQLQKWLQPFLPALPSMTSHPADAFLDRLYSLHEILQEHEDEIEEGLNRTNPLQAMWRDMVAALDGEQAPRLFPESYQDVPPSHAMDSKCKSFANACVNVIRETLTAESVSRPEVWSILMSVLLKMTEQATRNENIRKAFLVEGALQPLIQDCWSPEVLKQLSTEKRDQLLEFSWNIVHSTLAGNEWRVEDKVVQMLVEKVEVDGIEDGVTLRSTTFLTVTSMEQESTREFADSLEQLQLPARFVQICQDFYAKGTANSSVRIETADIVYSAIQHYTFSSEAFSAALIDAGMLPLLVEACRHLQVASFPEDGRVSSAVLNIVENVSRFPNLRHHLMEKGFVSLLMPYMGHENKGVGMAVSSVLAQLCKSEEDIKTFLDCFDEEGVLVRMKSWTESALRDVMRRFVCPAFQCVIYPKNFLELLSHVAGFPGQPSKMVESGWLGLLSRLLDEGEEEEKRLVLDCLLTLAQCPDVGGRLAENEALVARVRAVQREDCQASSLLLSRLQQLNMAASPP